MEDTPFDKLRTAPQAPWPRGLHPLCTHPPERSDSS